MMKIVAHITELTETLNPFNLSKYEELKYFDKEGLFCTHLVTIGYKNLFLEIREQSEE